MLQKNYVVIKVITLYYLQLQYFLYADEIHKVTEKYYSKQSKEGTKQLGRRNLSVLTREENRLIKRQCTKYRTTEDLLTQVSRTQINSTNTCTCLHRQCCDN